MEFLVNKRLLLIAAMALVATACSKESELINSGESVDMRFNQSMEWNREHASPEINVESEDYNILAIADLHVGTTANLDRFLNIAEREKPEAILVDGDLTGGLQEDYNEFEKHFPRDDSLRTFLIVGNHDLWYNGWGEYYARFGSSSYCFTVKTPSATDLYICLDTGGSTLGHLQMEWLKNLLESSRSDYRYCVIITHINLFRPRHTESTNPVVEELYVMVDLFTEYKVDMVITGHDHKQDAEVFGVTTYIQVAALEDGLSYAGYMNLRVKDGKIGYDFLTINE